jgi:uncharacterized protein YjdB
MKKYITYLLATALVGSAFVSCTERLREGEMRISTHKVHFSASDAETRTGLSIDGTTVTPGWNKTAVESIHLFEIDANDAVAYGETIAITTSEDKATAHFEADFPTDMSIIVDPSDPEEDSGAKGAKGTKGTRVSPYRYAAIIAQKPDKNNFTFVVPGEQHPDAETLKDPDADFLIGYSRKAYDTEHFFDEPVVDLYFDRVAALGRLAISNFAEDDGMVKSVTINAQNGLTGSASYADIDFENGKVNFVREEGPGAITLVYDGGMDIPADGPFYAYFVAIPGSATITSVEVVTDHYRYTKTIDGGKELTFSEKTFKSMNLDLSTATREEVAPSGLTWYKASMFEDGIDYLIVSEGMALNNGADGLTGIAVTDNDGVIEFEEAPNVALIWTAEAKVINADDNLIAGHFVLINNGEYLQRVSVGNHEYEMGVGGVPETVKYYAWDYDSEKQFLFHVSNESATFYCYYDDGWKTGYQNQKSVAIYTSRAPQELVFTPAASAEYDLATSEWIVAVPTLSGVQTSVTYALSEDSNPAVATVDADGTVHPLSKGAVTIVATAAGNDQYQAASASYTLRVVDSSVTTNTYIKVTSTSDLSIGDKYLLVFEGLAGDTDGDGNPKVFKPILDGNTFSKATGNALDVEIESGTITSDEFEGSHLTLESGYYLKADAVNRYLYPTGSSSGGGTLSAEATATNKLTIAFDNGIAQIKVNSGSNYLVWSTSSHYFSSNSQVSGSYSTGICLYKLDDGRLPQTPSFSPAEVNYDIAGSDALVKPTLSNAIGTVTYSSSNEAIATVDPSSGDVTVKKKGTVEITASAAGNSQYKPGSASYTLIITNSSITIPTWYKADEIVAGETYMIISNGNALKLDGTSIATVADASFSGASFQYEEDENLIWTAAASSGKFTFKSGSRFISRSSTSISASSSSGAAFSYDGTQNYLTVAGSSSTYYLYYSESQGSWMFSTSSGNTHTAAVYTMSPQLLPRNLAFSSVSVTHDLATQGTNVEEPTLSGVTDRVEYSSSNTSVATVNATTGEVTLAGITGFVVITASASKTDTYKAETVSYTIRVTDSSAPVTTATYTKVTSSTDLVVGEKYLLVYESGSKVFKPTLNGSNFATTGNALDVSITDETIVSDEYEDCQMTLEDGYYFYVASVSRYLYPTYNNMGAEETKSSSHSFNISISNGTATITRTSNNTTYNLRYSTSSSYFQASSSSANVALYKLENP